MKKIATVLFLLSSSPAWAHTGHSTDAMLYALLATPLMMMLVPAIERAIKDKFKK